MAAVSGGVTRGRVSVDGGGAVIGADARSLFADARVDVGGGWRGDAGVTWTQASFVDTSSLRVGGGWAGGAVDVGGWYRLGLLAYSAATETFVEHRVGLDAAWSTDPRVDLTLSVEGTTGADVNAAIVLLSAIWRPLP